jgi:formylglycine-generating enzyme required for sulfatase activity
VPVPIIGGPTAGKQVLFSIWDTRVQDYKAFADETKREWPKPDFEQGPTEPAVMVSWEDAEAFCQWLTTREQAAGRLPAGYGYRLPSDHEWSCAVGIGARESAAQLPVDKNNKVYDSYPWGTEWPPPAGAGNYAGEELQPAVTAAKHSYVSTFLNGYRDDFVETAPVGSFAANRFGLFDLGGNAWQWCDDWYDKEQKTRTVRGASWVNSLRGSLVSSDRYFYESATRRQYVGFRCVLAASAR